MLDEVGWTERDNHVVYSGELAQLHVTAQRWLIDDFSDKVELNNVAEYFYLGALAGVIAQGIEDLTLAHPSKLRSGLINEVDHICPRRAPQNVGQTLDLLDSFANYFGGDFLERCSLIRDRTTASFRWELGSKDERALGQIDEHLGFRLHAVVDKSPAGELIVEKLELRFDPPLPSLPQKSH
jgi:hypothetical protein